MRKQYEKNRSPNANSTAGPICPASHIRRNRFTIGVYERDIERILRIIGDDFGDAFELKQRLFENFSRLGRISFISRYVILNIL